jgi:hypothetical protein
VDSARGCYVYECRPSLRRGRASRPLLVALFWVFGPFTVKLPPHGCFDRMCFRPRRHLLRNFLIHMDICVWDVAHFHGCQFATALLCRVHVCMHMCSLFIFATYLNIVRPTTRGDLCNSATMVNPCNCGLRDKWLFCALFMSAT